MSWLVPTVMFFLLLEGFFSGSEIALVSANRVLLGRRARQGKIGAKLALKLLDDGPTFLTTTLIGTNICTVTNSILIARYLIHRLSEGQAEALAVAIFYPMTLIFGELIPKSFFQRHADRIAPKSALPLFAISRVLYPAVIILTMTSKTLLYLLGFKGDLKVPPITKREVSLILRGGIRGLKPYEQSIIHKALKFTETQAYQAMKPLIEVVAFPENMTLEEALDKMTQLPYSNFPIYSERIDKITGVVPKLNIIFSRDLNQPLKEIAKAPYFVPEAKPIDELLGEMTASRENFAVVVDEYGGAVGIITTEDIFEEVIGEIEDEFDPKTALYRRLGPDRTFISGRMEVEGINEILGLDIPEGDYETIAGFVIEHLGQVPKPGTRFHLKDLTFVVTKSQPNRVDEVLVIRSAREEERIGERKAEKDIGED